MMRRLTMGALLAAAILAVPVAGWAANDDNTAQRSEAHTEYATKLWDFLNRAGATYRSWTPADAVMVMPYGPQAGPNTKTYQNQLATESNAMPVGALIVTEHFAGEDDQLVGVSVWYRQADGYDAENGDWYWAHYTPQGTLAKSSVDVNAHAKRNFVVQNHDGRLWVLKIGTPELADFLEQGELAKHVIKPGAGPGGATLKAPDMSVIAEYLAQKPGFVTQVEDGRLWVFEEGSEGLAEFEQTGEPAKHVIRPGAGPGGMTIKSSDADVIDAYLHAKPGFMTKVIDGRLWVISAGSEEEAAFKKHGELAKHVIKPGAGPGGMTVKAPDVETIGKYMAAADGFTIVMEDGRAWVFRKGSPEYQQFKKEGEPAKSITRPGAGPGGLTLRATDAETLDAYQKAVN